MIRQAVILVGGRGTRLGALTRDIPKPMMPIAGDARLLDYLLHNVARHGVEDIVLLAGHLGDVLRERYEGAHFAGATVRVIQEPAPAGTAGALRYAADTLHEQFLMTNGDSLFDANYLALGPAMRADDVGAIALRRVPDAARYGRVEVEGDRIVAFHEKDASFKGEALISSGFYMLRRSILDLVGEPPCSIEVDVFPKLAAARRLSSIESDGYFIDIGLPETLTEGRETLPAQARRGAVFFDRDGTLTHDNGYTYKPEDLRWQPGAIEAIRQCNDAGRFAIVVTNQSGVARGYYTEADVGRFHARMQDDLHAHGAHVDAFYACPHHGEGTVPRFTHADHPDRKPNPGMLRRALAEWPIDRGASFLVGDTEHDIAAAAALGLDAHRVTPGELLGAVERGLSRNARTDAPKAGLRERAATAKAWLFDHALPLWWRNGFDRAGMSFHERLDVDGGGVKLPRRIRVQARQTAVYACAGRLGWQGPWREAVEAGAQVLLTRALHPDGGTRHLLAGDDRRDLYDLAFVIFGLSEASRALNASPDLIATAETLVDWSEANWTHPHGGFREGDLTATPPRRQNPHMHMLEAVLSLYEATKQPKHLARATKLVELFETRLFDHTHGALPEYFDEAWTPLAGEGGAITEPGHEFEWSTLLHRYQSHTSGRPSEIAEKLRVHAEIYGVSLTNGAVYDEVYLDGRVHTPSSRLWPHTERLKANLVRFERVRDPEAALNAAQTFDVLMRYLDTPTPGLWRDKLGVDGAFVEEPSPASSFYHIIFALAELIRVAELE